MKQWFKDTLKSNGMTSFLSSLMAIGIGLFVGFIILLISNPADALNGIGTILSGGFAGGLKGTGDVLYMATPIILTGLSVGFAFKTGLFNIGTPGQFIIGGFCAVAVALLCPGLGSMRWVVGLLCAIMGGAIWGAIPGLLNAFLNVNEVIATIMMNYTGMYFVNMMIKTNAGLFDKLKNQTKILNPEATLPKVGLDGVFEGSSVNVGIIIALFAVIIIYIVLNKTAFGYELKACGFNRFASKYAGINEKRGIVMSMIIAGALAGMGGGLLFLAGSGKHIQIVDVLAEEGFNGIPVALLGLSNPIGIFFSGLFISYLTQGGFYTQLYNYPPEIIEIIVATIVYCSALSLIVKTAVERKRMVHKMVSENGPSIGPLVAENADASRRIPPESDDSEDESRTSSTDDEQEEI